MWEIILQKKKNGDKGDTLCVWTRYKSARVKKTICNVTSKCHVFCNETEETDRV